MTGAVTLPVVALAAVVLMAVGPVGATPVAVVLLVLCGVARALVPPSEASTPVEGPGSGVGDEPGPLRP